MARIAINGFGRIGRPAFRIMVEDPEVELVAINSPGENKSKAHLLKYDSVYGTWKKKFQLMEDKMVFEDKEVMLLRERDPEKLPWGKMEIDVVLESTGIFTDREGASKHLKAGARKVLISAPAKQPDITLVYGVNHKMYDKKKHSIISGASCTTNCLAPVAKVLNDKFKIQKAFMTTVHAVTADQNLVDKTHEKDLRRARSAMHSIVPTTSGATKAVAEVIPELKGKMDGLAMRVPVLDGSIVDFVSILGRAASVEEINQELRKASEKEMEGIIDYCNEPIVSSDVIGTTYSAIFDALSTQSIGELCKVLAWYDNEWGYACRMNDISKIL